MSDNINIRMIGRPEDTLTVKPLGLKPYLLVVVDDIGEADNDDVSFVIEVGGGVPLDRDEIAEFFQGLAAAIADGEAVTAEADDTPTVEPLS